MFVSLRPTWDDRSRNIARAPMCIGGFVAPRRQTGHDARVGSGAAKRLHRLFALPHCQRPECEMSVDQQPPPDKPVSARNLPLCKKCLPKKCGKVPRRSNAKPGDGGEHGSIILEEISRPVIAGQKALASPWRNLRPRSSNYSRAFPMPRTMRTPETACRRKL